MRMQSIMVIALMALVLFVVMVPSGNTQPGAGGLTVLAKGPSGGGGNSGSSGGSNIQNTIKSNTQTPTGSSSGGDTSQTGKGSNVGKSPPVGVTQGCVRRQFFKLMKLDPNSGAAFLWATAQHLCGH